MIGIVVGEVGGGVGVCGGGCVECVDEIVRGVDERGESDGRIRRRVEGSGRGVGLVIGGDVGGGSD